MEQEEKLCDEVEIVGEFTYLGDRVSAGGGCETAVTDRTTCGWAKLRECSDFLFGRKFPLSLKVGIFKSYLSQTILYGSEAWFLKEVEMIILQRTEGSIVRAICGVQLKDRSTDLMFMLGLTEAIDRFAMASIVHWYSHVLRREDAHVLRRALDFEVEGQKNQGRPKRS